MRTYDKLIATIFASQAWGNLRPCSGTSAAAALDNPIDSGTTLQEAG